LTVIVASGDASRWSHVTRVAVGTDGADDAVAGFEVERARAYRDRLVLKLKGVDDPSAAEALKGHRVLVPGEDVPEPPDGGHYHAWLVGLAVVDAESREVLGRVVDVTETAGSDLLVVEETDGHELLIPIAPEFVHEVSQEDGRIEVRLPDGLRELNR